MFGWFHLSHGKTQDVELSVLKSKVTELETYRADYNTLLHKYNILMFQKISQHNTLKGKTTNTDPVVQDNHSLAGVDLIPHQEKDKNHSIVIDRLVYLP